MHNDNALEAMYNTQHFIVCYLEFGCCALDMCIVKSLLRIIVYGERHLVKEEASLCCDGVMLCSFV